MSNAQEGRPRFTRAYIESIGKSFDARGFWALVPFWLIGCCLLGWVIAFYLPWSFWEDRNLGVSVPIYTGILTINGLILALSWSAFARIHECITGDEFGAYLMDHGMLGDYIVYVGYVHAAQIVSIAISAAALFSLLYDIPRLADQIALAAMLGFSVYAIKQAANSVTVMHDLIWDKARFDRGKPRSSEKVIRIRKEG